MKFSIFLVSVALISISYAPYIIGIFHGKIRPHPATWLSWSISTSVMATILMFNGGGYATYSTWLMVLISVVIFVLAMKFRIAATVTGSDVVCLVGSVLATVVWLLVEQPFLSVLLLTASLFLGFVPSVRKAYSRPRDESALTWSVNAVRYALLVAIVESHTPTTVTSSLFWALVYGSAAAFLVVRRYQLDRAKSKDEMAVA